MVEEVISKDQAMEQLTFKEYIDPFTGSKNEQAQNNQRVKNSESYCDKTLFER